MDIDYTKKFIKQFNKQPKKVQKAFVVRLDILLSNPQSKALNVHALKGKYGGMYSMNVTGDVRALYYKKGGTLILFAFIGTHSQLY